MKIGAAVTKNSPSSTSSVALVLPSTALVLVGFSCKEDAPTSSTAEFLIRHGADVSGPPIYHVKLQSDESRDTTAPGLGFDASLGLYIERISGQTDISLWVTEA